MVELSRQRIRRNVWDRPDIAAVWSGEPLDPRESHAIRHQLSQSGFYTGLSRGNLILDLASGAYSYLDIRKFNGAKAIAVDLSSHMLQNLRRQYGQRYGGYVLGDGTQIPMGTNSVDRTLCTFMMRYLTEGEQKEALLEMIRVTKPGGKIALVDYEVTRHEGEMTRFSPEIITQTLLDRDIQAELAVAGKTVRVESGVLPVPNARSPMHFVTLTV